MSKLTFEKLQALKEIAHLKKEMERFSKRTIIEVFCHEIGESFHALTLEEKVYTKEIQEAFAFLIHAMEEKEQKNAG